MANSGRRRGGGDAVPPPRDAWLVEVAEAASRDAGGVPAALLGDYLQLLADAAVSGRRPKRAELNAVGLTGSRHPPRRLPVIGSQRRTLHSMTLVRGSVDM